MASESRYPIPAAPARAEIVVSNSRFIANAAHTPSVEEAKRFIADIRAAWSDASHHCYAYLVGYGASVIAGMSDDGEPTGTAGRPMLAVLRGANLGDTTVVITRYFGGNLLGTGGLVRAYGDAVKAALAVLPRSERVLLRELRIRVSYGGYAAARRVLEAHNATFDNEEFAADVSIRARLPADACQRCIADLAEQSAGQAIIEPG